jgi:hypothetical protein
MVSSPPGGKDFYLNLTANCTEGYSIKVIPDKVFSNSSEEIEVSITVTVPPQAPTLMSGQVILIGEISFPTEQGYSTSKMTSTASFSVLRYYAMNVTVGPEVMDGALRIFHLTVQNDGNGNDTYSVIATDPTGALNITQDKNRTRELGPNQTDEIVIIVRSPLEVLEYEYKKDGWNISIVVKSESLTYGIMTAWGLPKEILTKVHFKSVRDIEFKGRTATFTLIVTLLLIVVVRIFEFYKRRA